MGYLPQRWKVVWEHLDHPTREQLIRQMSFNTQLVRSHGRTIHKRSTIEILVKGKMLGEAAKMFSQPHRFEKFTYTTPASCDYCSHVLWGLVKTGTRARIYINRCRFRSQSQSHSCTLHLAWESESDSVQCEKFCILITM